MSVLPSSPNEQDSPRSAEQILAEAGAVCVRGLRYHWPLLCAEIAKRVGEAADNNQLITRAGLTLFRGNVEALGNRVLEALDEELRRARAEFLAAGARGSFPPPTEGTLPGLSAFEQQIVLSRIGARLTDPSETAFQHVCWRLANLLDVRVVPPTHNPFRPAVFVRAFMRAFVNMRIRTDELLPLTQQIDMPLTAPLRQTYTDLNRALEKLGVPLVRTVADGPNAESGNLRAAETSRRADATLLGLYDRVSQPAPPAARPGEPPAPPARQRSAQSPTEAPQAQALHDAQAPAHAPAAMPATDEDAAASVLSPAPALTPERLQALFAPPLSTLLARFDAGEAAPLPRELIDVQQLADGRIASLSLLVIDLAFDRLRDGPLVADAFRDLIAFLKLPVLRAALLDGAVLTSGFSAPRRLVDRLAAASLGWQPGSEDSESLLQAARGAVRAVLAGDGSVASIEGALAAFERHIAEAEAALADPVLRAKRAFAQSQESEALHVRFSIEVGKALQGMQVEPYLREFLFKRWVAVLVEAAREEQRTPDFVTPFRGAVAQLVWSVQPKLEPTERTRLIESLPELLRVITRGLELVNAPATEITEFLSQLMRTHAHAMQAMWLVNASVPVRDP
jgi:hypothetical protein